MGELLQVEEDDYVDNNCLGKGGFSRVYQVQSSHDVVHKVCPLSYVGNHQRFIPPVQRCEMDFRDRGILLYGEDWGERFVELEGENLTRATLMRREVRIMKKLASLHDKPKTAQYQGRWSFVDYKGLLHGVIAMEYLPGRNLDNIIFDPESSLQTRTQAVLDVLGTVEWIDKKGIQHRDINPRNIRVLPQGAGVLFDWGLAREKKDDIPDDRKIAGTPAFIPPSYAVTGFYNGGDLWQVGILASMAITGRHPFIDRETLKRLKDKEIITEVAQNSYNLRGLRNNLRRALPKKKSNLVIDGIEAALGMAGLQELRKGLELLLAQ